MTDSPSSRRRFLKSGMVSGAALLGMSELTRCFGLGSVSASEAAPEPEAVRFRPEIEPLVRLLEETPRDRIIEIVAQKVRGGLAYRETVAALMLAAVRNIRPGPVVGQKLHAAMVVNAAHLASLASAPEERWMPILWALDEWKRHQARDESEGDWTMAALDDSRLPAADKAPALLTQALDHWDEDAADRAIAAWSRTGAIDSIYETLWRYGARDYRDIGHKAIYTANSYRTLKVIGAQHAEGVLRSLVKALLIFRGDRPMSDARVHAPWRHTLAAVDGIPSGWQHGRADDGAARSLIQTFRTCTTDEAAQATAALLATGIGPRAVWDAVFTLAAELVLQRPRIYSLHAQTTANALHFGFRTARDDRTKRLLLIQAAAYMPLFRDDNGGSPSGFRAHLDERTDLRNATVDSLGPLTTEGESHDNRAVVEETFAAVGNDRLKAARTLLGGLKRGLPPEAVIAAARALNFAKGNDSHDYKFSSAILEDVHHLSPAFRPRFLAANIGLLRSSSEPDNPLVARIRGALA